MNRNELIATFARVNDEAYGSEKSAKIYKVNHDDGNTSFAISLFENDSLKSCQGVYISYGYAMRDVIEWIDNSDTYL